MRLFVALALQSWRVCRRGIISLSVTLLMPFLISLFFIFYVFAPSDETSWTFQVALVVDGDAPPSSLTTALERAESFNVRRVTRDEAQEQLRRGSVSAVFEYQAMQSQKGVLRVVAPTTHLNIVSDWTKQLAVSQPADLHQEYEVVVAERESASSKSKIQWFAPGLVIFTIMSLGFFTAGTNVTKARLDGSLVFYDITPVGAGKYVLAEVAVMTIVGCLLGIFFFSVFAFLTEFQITGSLALVGLVVVLSSIAFSSIGIFVAGVIPSAELGYGITPLVNVLLLFFGNMLWPASGVEELRPLVFALPPTYAVDALRHAVGGSESIFPLWLDLLVLLATIGLALAGAAKWFKFGSGKR